MKTLTRSAFEKARQFLMRDARPLERRLFEFHFDGAGGETVLAELAAFRNADGGFGRALEPDMRAPESSVLATVTGLDVLRRVGAPETHPLVRSAVQYLLDTCDVETRVWRIIPSTTDASPHAPWWNQSTLDSVFGHFLTNPRAKVLSHLYHYSSLSDEAFRRGHLDALMERFRTLGNKADADTLGGCTSLHETAGVPAVIREEIRATLTPLLAASVETDPAKWGEYCLKPLWAVTAPTSPFYAALRDAVETNLDYEIDRQLPDGAWDPFWDWGGAYPDDWEVAKHEWKGILTCNMLTTLRAFGRIEQ